MFRISIAFISLAVLSLSISCGTEAPAGPEEIARRMFEAAQSHNYDKMYTCMSPEMQNEINEAALAGIEIVSFTIDQIEYSPDSTEAELEYSVTLKHIATGETEVESDDMDLIRTSAGDWLIVDM